jgi:hypothetical protein
VKEANEREDLVRILGVSKNKTKEGEQVIRKIEGVLTKIENEALKFSD